MFKGFAIIVIVFAHLILLEPVLEGYVEEPSLVKNTVIEFFYVGLLMFFAISGYFYRYEEGFNRKAIYRVVKLVLAFLICMVVLTTVMYVYLLALGYNISFDSFIDTLVNGLTGGGGAFQPYVNETTNDISVCGIYAGYYFIEVLVLSTLVYYAIAKYAMKDNVCTLVIIIALLTVSMLCVEVIGVKLPYYLELVPIGTAAMLMGTLGRKYSIVDTMENKTFDKRLVIAVLICLVVGIILCVSPLRSDLGFHRSHFGLFGGFSAYSILIVAMVCGFVLLYVATLVSKIPYISTFLVFVGRYSLEILLLSTFYCKLFIAPFITLEPFYTYPYMDMSQVVISAVVSIALSILTAMIVRLAYAKIKEKGFLASLSSSSSRTS